MNSSFTGLRATAAARAGAFVLLLALWAPFGAVGQTFLGKLLRDAAKGAIDNTSNTAKEKIDKPKVEPAPAAEDAGTSEGEAETADATSSASTKRGAAAPSRRGAYEYAEEGYLKAKVVSVRRNGGTLDLVVEYTNISNNDFRIQLDVMGSLITAVVDDNGGQWKYLTSTKGGTPGTKGIMFSTGTPTRVPLRFNLTSGGGNVSKFRLTNPLSIIFPDRSAPTRKLQVSIRDIPASL